VLLEELAALHFRAPQEICHVAGRQKEMRLERLRIAKRENRPIGPTLDSQES
jgi:hypothetical protein